MPAAQIMCFVYRSFRIYRSNLSVLSVLGSKRTCGGEYRLIYMRIYRYILCLKVAENTLDMLWGVMQCAFIELSKELRKVLVSSQPVQLLDRICQEGMREPMAPSARNVVAKPSPELSKPMIGQGKTQIDTK